MSTILETHHVFPKNYYTQTQITEEFLGCERKESINPRLVQRFHKSVQVQGRHLALPLEAYNKLSNFKESNQAYNEVALALGEACLLGLLEKADFKPEEISQIIFTTVTGLSVPSIDAKLLNRIGFLDQIKRVPLFGLGCLAGAAGISRAHDYLKAYPKEAVLLLAIELCSLTVQRQDLSLANLVASGLFGDGAAAVLLVGKEHPRAQNKARVIATQSAFFKHTERVMGWDIGHEGFQIVLNAEVPKIAEQSLPPVIDSFLASHNLKKEQITHWIAHPGGPKVIDGLEAGLGLSSQALALSRESLAEIGNLSSASVLIILQKTLEERRPKRGEKGVLLAMGPGFCAELVLLEWC